jgi:hypothetical protein
MFHNTDSSIEKYICEGGVGIKRPVDKQTASSPKTTLFSQNKENKLKTQKSTIYIFAG